MAFVVSHFSDKCTRVDVVFDRYNPNSIKEVTRAKRKKEKNKGIRRDLESRKQGIGYWAGLLSLKKIRLTLFIFCPLKFHSIM